MQIPTAPIAKGVESQDPITQLVKETRLSQASCQRGWTMINDCTYCRLQTRPFYCTIGVVGIKIPLMNKDELHTLQVANIILLHQECADIPRNDWPLKTVLIWMTQIFPLTVLFPFKFELFAKLHSESAMKYTCLLAPAIFLDVNSFYTLMKLTDQSFLFCGTESLLTCQNMCKFLKLTIHFFKADTFTNSVN